MDEITISINGQDLLLIGKKRYYKENLFERDFSLENTTPYILRINQYEIIETAWIDMICSVASYLIMHGNKTHIELLKYKTDWSKAAIFSEEKRTSFRKVGIDIYINYNHTALHSCWLMQDLLNFFEIDLNDVEFYIHRPSSTEPKVVKNYFAKKAYREFEFFMVECKDKTAEQANKIISNIETYLNVFLRKVSKSYDDVFLFDDILTATNYINRIKEFVDKQDGISDKNKKILHKYCAYLLEFYKI